MHGRFTAGVATKYGPSIITAEVMFQHLAEGFPIGMRFHSAPVVRLADAKPVHLGHAARADGAWRVYIFANRNDPTSGYSHFEESLRLIDARNSADLRNVSGFGAHSGSIRFCGLIGWLTCA